MEITPEQEREALTPVDVEKVRDEVIEELGFDPENDLERIEKAVNREVKQREYTAKAIQAKINLRKEKEAADKELQALKESGKGNNNVTPDEFEKKFDERMNARLEERDLNDLDLADELKEEVKKIAKLNNISVKKALSDPYIVFKKTEYEKEARVSEAAISRKNNSSGRKSYTEETIAEIDVSTPEGRAEFDKAMATMK
jgi:acetylornithine deacetylase/succinyl-diaminopimelate desuccinylase-like protein